MATDKQTNKYGLSRHIGEDTARAVRKACGYGCVICGSALYEYEHIAPEFADAREHDPEKIALLCSQHHAAVTRRTLSKSAIKKARSNPWCIQHGYAHDFLELPDGPVGIQVGNTQAQCQVLLNVYGWPVIWFEDAEVPGGPKRLNAWFADTNGNLVARINRNELHIFDTSWDVKMVGPRLTIGNPREPHVLILERVGACDVKIATCNLKYFDWQLKIRKNGALSFLQNDIPIVTMDNCAFIGSGTAFALGPPIADTRVKWADLIPASINGAQLFDGRGNVCGFVLGRKIIRKDGATVAMVDENRYVWRIVTNEFVGRLSKNTVVIDSDLDPAGNPAFALPSYCPSNIICDDGLPNSTLRLFSR